MVQCSIIKYLGFNGFKIKYFLGTVNANDDDSAEFGLVNYMITGDNDNNFLIDSATGEISIVKALEGDPHASYMFSVVASDSGVPPLATVAVVTVPVEDINDNPPILRLDNPQVSIFENMSYDSIFIFIADDLDRTSPNNIVEYFIIDSFPVLSQLSSFFVINQTTGELSTGLLYQYFICIICLHTHANFPARLADNLCPPKLLLNKFNIL